MTKEELNPVILVVDDDEGVLQSFREILEGDYEVLTSSNGKEALEIISNKTLGIVFLDIKLPDMDGFELLRRIKEIDSSIEIIMVTATNEAKAAVQAMKMGAYDYITKPFEPEEIWVVVEKVRQRQDLIKEVVCLRDEVQKPHAFESIVGSSEIMQDVYELISKVSQNDATVFITGESGTGKELVARAIHNNSPCRDKPFIAVNCATIPNDLLESELFGYEKGAFTGATTQKLGKFELANGSTFFLDEISTLSTGMQAKILRTLQEREIERVGGVRTIKVDVRIIAATNTDIVQAVKDGSFREDLYYRLNVVPITLPRLCERREDISLLAHYFLNIYNQRFKKNMKGISKEAMEYMKNYDWPGNVRELKNVIERIVALNDKGIVTHKHLPLDILLKSRTMRKNFSKQGTSLKEARDEFERGFILQVLKKVGGNQVRAAQIMDVHRNTLLFKMNSLDLVKDKMEKFVKNGRD